MRVTAWVFNKEVHFWPTVECGFYNVVLIILQNINVLCYLTQIISLQANTELGALSMSSFCAHGAHKLIAFEIKFHQISLTKYINLECAASIKIQN